MEENFDMNEVSIKTQLEKPWNELEVEMNMVKRNPNIVVVEQTLDAGVSASLAIQNKLFLMNKAINEPLYHLGSSLDTNC